MLLDTMPLTLDTEITEVFRKCAKMVYLSTYV